jgi:putative ABC transport system substrate-binding protein
VELQDYAATAATIIAALIVRAVLLNHHGRDFDAIFADLVRLRAGSLVIGIDPLFSAQSEQLATLSLRHAVPMIFRGREFAAAGGRIGYGGNNADSNRLAGVYAGRILKGEKPADLPVQQATNSAGMW